MSLKETVDPKTGAVTWDWDGSSAPAAPKPQAAPKAEAPKPQGSSNPVLSTLNTIVRNNPVGMAADNLLMVGSSVGAGIDEFQRTGDLGKAGYKAIETYGKELEAPGRDFMRTTQGAGRDFLQNTSNLLQDAAAKVGIPGATPTSAAQPDTPFLGVLPPIPRIKSSGPIEDLGRTLVQAGLSVIPINKGLGLAGAGLKALPGGARVAGAAQGVRGAIAASKPAQAIAKTPLLGPAAASLAENVTTKNALTGAIVDMLVSNPYEGRLYDHAERFYESVMGTPLELPFEDLLKGNTSAVGLDARWGQAVDGAGLGTGLGFIWRQGKMAAAALRLRNARQGVDAGTAGALDVRKAQKDLQSAVKEFAEEVVDQGQAAMPKPTVQELIQQRLDNLDQVRNELKTLPKVKRGDEGYKAYQAARKELLAQEKAINLDVQRLSVQELRDRAGRVTGSQAEPPVAQAATPEAVPSPQKLPAESYTSRLNYSDINPAAGPLNASGKRYAKALADQDPVAVNATSQKLREAFDNAAARLDIDLGPNAASESWSMWDIGKQLYMDANPTKSSKQYTLGNPLTNTQVQADIVDRMLGFELTKGVDAQGKRLKSSQLTEIGRKAREAAGVELDLATPRPTAAPVAQAAADVPPAAAAPEPSVPSAGSSAPAAGPTPRRSVSWTTCWPRSGLT
jgi:hypothetical protein